MPIETLFCFSYTHTQNHQDFWWNDVGFNDELVHTHCSFLRLKPSDRNYIFHQFQLHRKKERESRTRRNFSSSALPSTVVFDTARTSQVNQLLLPVPAVITRSGAGAIISAGWRWRRVARKSRRRRSTWVAFRKSRTHDEKVSVRNFRVRPQDDDYYYYCSKRRRKEEGFEEIGEWKDSEVGGREGRRRREGDAAAGDDEWKNQNGVEPSGWRSSRWKSRWLY